MRTKFHRGAICTGSLLLGLLVITALPSYADNASTGKSAAAMTMNLGPIQVHGQKQIVKMLQAIKIALKQPISSSRADENKVVCRISKSMGRAVWYLDCATNRYYNQRRYEAQTAVQVAESSISAGTIPNGGCTTGACYETVFAGMNAGLDRIHGHKLHTKVNAAALKALLEKIPDPVPDAATTSKAKKADVLH